MVQNLEFDYVNTCVNHKQGCNAIHEGNKFSLPNSQCFKEKD